MQCPNCSAEVTGGKFCINCGSPLPIPEPTNAPMDEVLEPDVVEEPAANPFTPPTYDHAPGQGGGAGFVPPVPPANTANETPAGPSYSTSSDGILNSAWDDLIHDPSMLKKVALMAVFELVPILNFVNIGYSLRWGRRAAFRAGDKLPQKIFGDRAFEIGFYGIVIAVAWALVLGIISAVPLLGALVALAAVPFLQLAMGYMAMTEEIGAGFRIPDLWEKGKRSYGGLLALAYVPNLVVAVVASVVLVIGLLPLGVSAIGLYDVVVYGSSAATAAFLSSMGAFFFVLLILIYICSALSVFARLVTNRALGYWMGRMAPEWIQESINKGADPR